MSNKYPCVYYDNGKCQKFSDDHYTSWCVFSYCEHQTPSNGDRIRAMTDEELAEVLCVSCAFCACHPLDNCPPSCQVGVLDWLKKPAEEDT